MLGTLPFIAVRQELRQTAHPAPLGLARADELVHHHLGAVGEVAELRFPDHQRVRLRGREAVLEAEHRLFRQHRIDDDEIALVLADVLQRDVRAFVPALALLVVQHRVPMREGAARGILAG